jgi:hypothetical protein
MRYATGTGIRQYKRVTLTGQDLDFLKQLRAAGERGRTIQASNIRVALDRLARGGFVVARPTGQLVKR